MGYYFYHRKIPYGTHPLGGIFCYGKSESYLPLSAKNINNRVCKISVFADSGKKAGISEHKKSNFADSGKKSISETVRNGIIQSPNLRRGKRRRREIRVRTYYCALTLYIYIRILF